MQINLNYQLKIQAWVVALIVIAAVAAYFIAKDGWSEQVETERDEKLNIQAQLNSAQENLKQCNSKRIQDSIKNSINNTPNIPADEYMKRYKKVRK